MLENYIQLAKGGEVTINLSKEEEAAMLAVNSEGLLGVSPYDLGVIEEIIASMVYELWT